MQQGTRSKPGPTRRWDRIQSPERILDATGVPAQAVPAHASAAVRPTGRPAPVSKGGPAVPSGAVDEQELRRSCQQSAERPRQRWARGWSEAGGVRGARDPRRLGLVDQVASAGLRSVVRPAEWMGDVPMPATRFLGGVIDPGPGWADSVVPWAGGGVGVEHPHRFIVCGTRDVLWKARPQSSPEPRIARLESWAASVAPTGKHDESAATTAC